MIIAECRKKEHLKWVLGKSTVCLVVPNTECNEDYLSIDTKEIIYSKGIYDSCDIAKASLKTISEATELKDVENTNFFIFYQGTCEKRISDQQDIKKDLNPLEIFGDLVEILFSTENAIKKSILEHENKKNKTIETLIDSIKITWNFYYFCQAMKNYSKKLEKESKDPYEILGISPNATVLDIKKARDKKLIKFHPDKITQHNLDPAFMKFASERTNELYAAYEFVMAKLEDKT